MPVERDVIVIIKGGTVQAVFSAGVMSAFAKHDLYPRIHSIYGVSSGAHIAAFFLAGKTNMDADAYYDILHKKRKFLIDLSFKIICRKFWDLFIHNKSVNIIDLDYIEDLEKNVLKIDTDKIKNSPINFFVRVFNKKTLSFEYLDAKIDTIDKIIQSSKVPPYAYTKKNNGPYIDGGIMPNRDFINNVIKKHPDKKIIYIFNDKKTFKRTLKYLPWDLLDILFKTRHLGIGYGLKHLFNIFNYPYIKGLKKYKNVYIVYDDSCASKTEKNPDMLKKSYMHGFEKGEDLLKRLDHNNNY